jgi:hypothetical protein
MQTNDRARPHGAFGRSPCRTSFAFLHRCSYRTVPCSSYRAVPSLLVPHVPCPVPCRTVRARTVPHRPCSYRAYRASTLPYRPCSHRAYRGSTATKTQTLKWGRLPPSALACFLAGGPPLPSLPPPFLFLWGFWSAALVPGFRPGWPRQSHTLQQKHGRAPAPIKGGRKLGTTSLRVRENSGENSLLESGPRELKQQFLLFKFAGA